jgi:hypothetical protein
MRNDDLRALSLRVGAELDEVESRNVLASWHTRETLQETFLYLIALSYLLLERHARSGAVEPAQEARRRAAVEALRDLRAASLLANMGHVGSAGHLAAAAQFSLIRMAFFLRFPEEATDWLAGRGPATMEMHARLAGVGADFDLAAPAEEPVQRAAPLVPPLAAMLGEGFQVDRVRAVMQSLCRACATLARLEADGLAGVFDEPYTRIADRAALERALIELETEAGVVPAAAG